jgi:hypothetical protein
MRKLIARPQRDWAKQAERQGWEIRLTDRGHMQFVPPDDAHDIVTMPASSFKGNRGANNARSELRRRGLSVDR